MLVALGRKPATDDIGVELVGLEPGKTIHVDAHMQVPGHEWLYAIGDINGRSLFTHMGKYQARVSADYLLGHDRVLSHGADGPLSPRVIFTEPQVAAVGRYDRVRREGGHRLRSLRGADLGQRGRLVLRARRPRHGAVDRRPRAADRRRLHHDGAPRSPTSCMPRRSRSSARCRSSGCGTRCRAFPRAARCGSNSSLKKKGRGGSRSRSLPDSGASADLAGAAGLSPQASLFASLTSASKKTLFRGPRSVQERTANGSRILRNFDIGRTFWYDGHRTSRTEVRMSPSPTPPAPERPKPPVPGASSCSPGRPDGENTPKR